MNAPFKEGAIRRNFLLISCVSFLWTLSAGHAVAEVSQSPLLLGGGNVPGNLALVPSVEWPTILSVANTGNYSSSNTYVGYFDPQKCYVYNGAANAGWFEPSRRTTTRQCGGNFEWSGNFLNWAATPTIDPFRSALTGGYRYKDEIGLTVLEKARHTGQSTAGNRLAGNEIPATELSNAAPIVSGSSNWSNFYIRLAGLGNEMLFAVQSNGMTDNPSTTANEERTAEWIYLNDPNEISLQWNNGKLKTGYTNSSSRARNFYRVKIRVKVCDPAVGLEENCKLYSANNYKPEGLIQQYSDSLRYSVFGYLNDSNLLRDGGVLRAQQKYVGPTKRDVGQPNAVANAAQEWDSETGIFIRNPDQITQSMGITIADSGVINYLNKFGQLTQNSHKSHDPVSELFYTATRYFKNQGNVSSYTTTSPSYLPNPSSDQKAAWADGFPVITNWNDPIQYACQKNVILGIGDTNTHRDKNLPGNSSRVDEPAVPSEVTADTSVDAATSTQKVAALENITISTPFNSSRNSSAYIAGLAYLANTQDIRPDWTGKQTISTHWVDVRENQTLAGRASNQYWLATKYGGFKVPKDFGDPYERTSALPQDWWTNGDRLENNDLRPKNFYVASDATRMIQSLKEAFANIVSETQSTTSALSTNSTRLNTGTVVFQSLIDSSTWSGDLLAKTVDSNGNVSDTPSWKAATKLDAISETSLGNRRIFTSTAPTSDTGSNALRSTSAVNFTWDTLSTNQQNALRQVQGSTTLVSEEVGRDRLAFLRGSRTNERSTANPDRPFRERGSRLGDIANSDPQFIHKQNFGYAQLPESAGFASTVAAAYTTFRSSTTYQNRPPLVVVGANDGMLHGFDASTGSTGGQELFAYIPNSVFNNLYELTLPSYAHRYYVDGTPRIGDAYVGGSWKTLVIGSTGAGGRSIFALDITNPASMSTSNVLWEFTHAEMGYTLGRPSLVPLPNGKFGVVVTSGYARGTSTTDGYIWILDAADGSVLKRFTLPNSGDLGAPLAIDINNDKVTDRIYAADTKGKVWRVDISGSTVSAWDAPSALKDGANIIPLFVARDSNGDAQPITAPLDAAYTTDRRIMLVFGTGSFYQTTDNEIPENPQVNSFYGIIDGGAPISGRNALRQQEIIAEVSSQTLKGRALTNNTVQSTDKGWFIDLKVRGGSATGERVVSQASLGGNRVTFSTLIPSSNPCDAGGTSWIMSVDLASGGRLPYSYFDYNGDGTINENDYMTIGEGDSQIKVPVSGISDPDEGAIKGTLGLDERSSGKRYLCYASSVSSTSGNGSTPICIEVLGGNEDSNRLSWQEVRSNQ